MGFTFISLALSVQGGHSLISQLRNLNTTNEVKDIIVEDSQELGQEIAGTCKDNLVTEKEDCVEDVIDCQEYQNGEANPDSTISVLEKVEDLTIDGRIKNAKQSLGEKLEELKKAKEDWATAKKEGKPWKELKKVFKKFKAARISVFKAVKKLAKARWAKQKFIKKQEDKAVVEDLQELDQEIAETCKDNLDMEKEDCAEDVIDCQEYQNGEANPDSTISVPEKVEDLTIDGRIKNAKQSLGEKQEELKKAKEDWATAKKEGKPWKELKKVYKKFKAARISVFNAVKKLAKARWAKQKFIKKQEDKAVVEDSQELDQEIATENEEAEKERANPTSTSKTSVPELDVPIRVWFLFTLTGLELLNYYR